MDVIGGRYTCVPEGKHGRGQGTGKYKCFKERVIYIRGPSTTLAATVLCAFRETTVTRQLISKIAINRPSLSLSLSSIHNKTWWTL